jgi:hypothetical protein
MRCMYLGKAVYIQRKTGAVRTAPVTKITLRDGNLATSTKNGRQAGIIGMGTMQCERTGLYSRTLGFGKKTWADTKGGNSAKK